MQVKFKNPAISSPEEWWMFENAGFFMIKYAVYV